MVVQHNLTAMNSNRMLGVTTKAQAKTTEKLSSGYKINRAADDAAGLAISEKMRKQIRGLTQASANAQDGISAVQTAEGALTEVQDMLQRMNELAVKSSNGTNSESDRASIQAEIDQLATEIDRVAETTKFNETYLLKGDKDVEKVYSYSYNAVSASNRATATMSTDDATNLTATVTFNEAAKAADQNAIAKALRDQGITITAEQNGGTGSDKNAVKSYGVTLNGSAANAYKVNTVNAQAGTFEIVDLQGNKIADVTTSGGSGDTVAAKSSAVITANSINAAVFKGDTSQFYDADGNAVSANALGNYFSRLSDGQATGGVITMGSDLYDANGKKYDKSVDADKTAAMAALASGKPLYSSDPRTATVTKGTFTVAKDGADLKSAVVDGVYEYLVTGSRAANGVDTTKAGWYDAKTGAESDITGLTNPDTNGVAITIGIDDTKLAKKVADSATATTGQYSYKPGVSAVAALAGKQLYDAVGNKLDMGVAAGSVSSSKNLTGSLGLSLHVGADATRNNQIDLKIEAMSAKGLGINGLRVDGKDDSNALKSIETIKEALSKVSAQRSQLGAVQNRLEHTINNLDNVVENTTSAESAIRDTDMATTMVQYSKNNILAQAGTSMLAQANQSNQSVLSLLQ